MDISEFEFRQPRKRTSFSTWWMSWMGRDGEPSWMVTLNCCLPCQNCLEIAVRIPKDGREQDPWLVHPLTPLILPSDCVKTRRRMERMWVINTQEIGGTRLVHLSSRIWQLSQGSQKLEKYYFKVSERPFLKWNPSCSFPDSIFNPKSSIKDT